MPVYNLEYRDGENYTINADYGSKDLSIQRTKAGNLKTFAVKDFGVGLQRDEVILSYFQTEYDSEGDPLYNPGIGRTTIIQDPEYFQDLIAYTNAGGIIGQGNITIDTLLKQRLEQTRCFNIAGDFIQPIYFNLDGSNNSIDPSTGEIPVDPSTFEPIYDGLITATWDVSGGYSDIEIRFQEDGSTWGSWLGFNTGTKTVSNLPPATYNAQVRTTDVSLMIEPIETTSIT